MRELRFSFLILDIQNIKVEMKLLISLNTKESRSLTKLKT